MKKKIVCSLLLILLIQGLQGLALREEQKHEQGVPDVETKHEHRVPDAQQKHEQRIPGLAYERFPQYTRGCKGGYCWSMCDGAGRWCYTSNWAGTSANVACNGNDSSNCPVLYQTGYKDNCAGTCWYF